MSQVIRAGEFAFLCSLGSISTWLTLVTLKKPWLLITRNSRDREIPSKVRNLIVLTGVSSVCFTLSLILRVISKAHEISVIGWANKESDRELEDRVYDRAVVSRVLALCLQLLGYTSLQSIWFGRITVVFEGTAYSIGDRTVSFGFGLIPLSLVYFSIGIVIYFLLSPLIAVIILVSYIIEYLIFSLWISWKFMRNTQEIAMESDLMGDSIYSHSFVELSLRLTIVTITAILSSIILGVGLAFTLLIPNYAAFRIRNLMAPIDSLINCYCLLCSYHESSGFYRIVFGWFHSQCLNRLFN